MTLLQAHLLCGAVLLKQTRGGNRKTEAIYTLGYRYTDRVEYFKTELIAGFAESESETERGPERSCRINTQGS